MPDSGDQQLLIIDTDAGVDDALAILLALSSPCKILAITCVSGNVQLSNVYTNVLRILNHCGRLEVPVYQGCRRPLVTTPMNAVSIHGKDGLGGAAERYPLPTDGAFHRRNEHASQALVSLAHKHVGAATLVTLGPLTNLAVAGRLDPDFFANLKEIVVMGGTCDGLVHRLGEQGHAQEPHGARHLGGHDAAHARRAQAAGLLLVRPASHGDRGGPWRGSQNRVVPGLARTTRHQHARRAHRGQAARPEGHQAQHPLRAAAGHGRAQGDVHADGALMERSDATGCRRVV
ncbi:uncharacterized protein LOC119446633 isoform X2 [Dermacentor silvarum]|uniref:uncharacterized protein LOC119446633 isoform X2 n=1 Tax=Dermacentor silvarum TaxID=543639 RepID=UPI0021006959|nr:uncharacterized protein LOC119446633 isoform X2 [Dermacentor silvarum]